MTAQSRPPPYVEFGVQSNFSFLCGASKPEELVVSAALLGYSGMGLADRNTVAGVVRAWSQSKTVASGTDTSPFPYYPGARLVFADGTPDVLAYPRDRKGWGNLCRLLTQANMREESPKGAPLVYRSDLLEWGECMSLAVLPDLDTDATDTLHILQALSDHFRTSIRLAASPSYTGRDRFRLEQAAALATACGMRLMATNEVLYHASERRPLQDVLTAIRLKTTVMDAGFELKANAERHMKTPAEMARLFRNHPQALTETVRFAGELEFSLKELRHNYPEETTEEGVDPQTQLERLAWEGARHRYRGKVPEKVTELLRSEFAIVRQKDYARYFLTVNDIVRYSREIGVLCQGRGSAANSVICYCLGITDVDPEQSEVLFDRFISVERDEPPDIDVDFEHEKREEIIAYIYRKYNEEHTALAAAVINYRGRSALREVAKAMGLSDDIRGALSGSIWGWWSSSLGEKEAKAGGLDKADPRSSHVIRQANEILGFPRHLSQHVGGFVITKDRLDEIVPIIKTAMDDRKMVEWDKDDLDAVNLLKVDILALGMLSCLRRCFDLLHHHYDAHNRLGEPVVDFLSLPKEEPDVYDMICRADTLGVFQIESRAQMSMLPRLQPRKFYDLVIEVAIVRPGPIQGDMVHPYLRRRMKLEREEYYKPELEAILKRTLGVPLFQEQAMKIAIDIGGFSPSEADKLRRAMATFRRNGTIHLYRDKLIKAMVAKDYPEEFANRCFRQIEGFGEYGFPESHAASFALLVYASCWFKTFYPDVFCAAILNAQPMGFYAPAQLVRDARDHGIEIRAVDINFSGWDCTLEEAEFDPNRILHKHAEMRTVIRSRHSVRLGLRQVKGLSRDRMDVFVERRGIGYESVRDVWLRSGLDRDEIEKLAQADAFRSIGLDRRAALWQVRALDRRSAAETMPLFDRPDLRLRDHEPETRLPIMPDGEHVIHDYRSLGLSLKAHPVSFLRQRLDRIGVMPNERLSSVKNGSRVTVCGLVLVRQRPGKGNAIFLTLEDDNGIANVIVWQRDFERLLPTIMGSKLLRVAGRLQCESSVIHIVAESMENLTPWLALLAEEAAQRTATARTDHATGGELTQNPPERRLDHSRLLVDELVTATSKVMPKGRNFQ